MKCRFDSVRAGPGTLWAVAVVAATFATAVSLAAAGPLRVNFTGSLPRGLYRTRAGPLSRGATVIACLPANAGKFARERGYIWRGNCPGNAAPVGKVVSAIAGDTVTTSSTGLIVNGRPVQNTGILAHDSKGRQLAHVPYARYVVAPGELWLLSSYNPRSYDSRYFGPVPLAAVLSRVDPVLTFGPSQPR